MLSGPFTVFCYLDLDLLYWVNVGCWGEKAHAAPACVSVCAVPSDLLLFSHLHPQELVRPQPAYGLREKVCLRLLLRHILGREVEHFC